jgi:hypothetical protein
MRFWKPSRTGTFRRRIFPPNCSRPDCAAGTRLWRTDPMILMDGRWLCSTRCVETEANARFEPMRMPDASAPKHRVPVGLLMLARGYLTEQQLQEVLRAQVQAGHGKIGTWAQKLNFASERQVLNALSLQWSCPLLSLQTPPDPACRRMIPWPLLQSLRMLPVRFVRSTSLLIYSGLCGRRLWRAFRDRTDPQLSHRAVPGQRSRDG